MSEQAASSTAIPGGQEPAESPELQVEIRCGFAELAQLEAEAAAARLEEARQQYDELAATLAQTQAQVDPGLFQAAKDKAHAEFRAAVAGARSRGQVEAAAVAWLTEINRTNGKSRLALARVEHEHALVDGLLRQLTTLSATAEATASMAVAAVEACAESRAALASKTAPVEAAPESPGPPAAVNLLPADGAWTPEVTELAKAAKRTAAVSIPGAESTASHPLAARRRHGPPSPSAETPAVAISTIPAAVAPVATTAIRDFPATDPLSFGWLVVDPAAANPQAIVKLIRRDDRTMSALVDRLSSNDPSTRPSWQLHLSTLVDSIVAAAIDDACFEFAAGNPFWDQFRPVEAREIARGLAALGFRYDGLGGFVDGRVPTNRDLALAVGQAGLLPIKIRHWPSAAEAAQLFSGVHVSADTFLAARAPSLSLGELVRLLGRRAELLADLWNNWPRCRPLLFSTAL
jgi:hypothetical protein